MRVWVVVWSVNNIYQSVRCWMQCENYLCKCEMLNGVWTIYIRVWIIYENVRCWKDCEQCVRCCMGCEQYLKSVICWIKCELLYLVWKLSMRVWMLFIHAHHQIGWTWKTVFNKNIYAKFACNYHYIISWRRRERVLERLIIV